jgi:hypothetical protein
MNATPKVEMCLIVIELHPLHSPPFVRVCSHLNTFSWPHGPLHSTFNHKPNVRVVTKCVYFVHIMPLMSFASLCSMVFNFKVKLLNFIWFIVILYE